MTAPDTEPAAPAFSQLAGRFGRYLLLGSIARGGMGEIHLALAGAITHAQKLCVVKTIRAEFAHQDDLVTRFLDEGRVLCALQHPNIGQVLEVGIERGVPFLAMEYVGGTDLAELIDAGRSSRAYLPTELVVGLLAAALDGIAYAHRATALDGTPFNLVHRDLSPENVRVSWDGDVKVLDFGTALADGRAAHTAHGGIFGKPGYMAPEQARRETLDPRTDLYALGVVAWELLTLHDWMTLDLLDHLQAVTSGVHRPAPPSSFRPVLPAAVDTWVSRMTAHDPAKRWADATTARRALLAIAQTLELRTDRESIAEGLRKLLPGAQDTESARNRQWIAAAREQRGSLADPPVLRQQVTTEPLAPRDAQLLPGTPYRLGALLGAGGMGEVYAAEHTDLGRSVALKVLAPSLSNDPSLVQRFRLEARAIAALSHPNLVHVHDLGTTDDGRLYYAMERLRGMSLHGRLARAREQGAGRLDAAECVRIGVAVARGLAAAHAVGVVHRDIKPENIFLTDDGGVKVLDFGVAKTSNATILGGTDANVTRAGELFGSPAYMAPEQARGIAVDARADLYALGAVLYECATGTPLFRDATVFEVLARQLSEVPEAPRRRAPDAQIPAAFDALVMQCLAKDPEARPRTAAALADALAASIDGTDAAETALPRRPTRTLAGAVLGTALVATMVAVALSRTHRTDPAPTTQTLRSAPLAAAPVAPTVPAPMSAAAVAPAAAQPSPAPPAAATTPPVMAPSTEVPTSAAPPSRHAGSPLAQAQQAFAAGRYRDTLTFADEVVAQGGPRALDARVLIGKARNALGQHAEAVRALRMVLDRDPTHRGAREALTAMGETP